MHSDLVLKENSYVDFLEKIYLITKCTTTGYFLPLFSLLKQKEEEKENVVVQPVLNHFLKELIDFL